MILLRFMMKVVYYRGIFRFWCSEKIYDRFFVDFNENFIVAKISQNCWQRHFLLNSKQPYFFYLELEIEENARRQIRPSRFTITKPRSLVQGFSRRMNNPLLLIYLQRIHFDVTLVPDHDQKISFRLVLKVSNIQSRLINQNQIQEKPPSRIGILEVLVVFLEVFSRMK